jgi:Rrf2 family protein
LILSQSAVYALKAAMHLAEHEGDRAVRADDIAASLDVPRNYLSKILHVLARDGVLISLRGPTGGFRLSRDAGAMRLFEVVAPFDDFTPTAACLLGRETCSDSTPCAAHARWKGVFGEVQRFLNETTVRDLTCSGTRLHGVCP